jgi:hypothetical protein
MKILHNSTRDEINAETLGLPYFIIGLRNKRLNMIVYLTAIQMVCVTDIAKSVITLNINYIEKPYYNGMHEMSANMNEFPIRQIL